MFPVKHWRIYVMRRRRRRRRNLKEEVVDGVIRAVVKELFGFINRKLFRRGKPEIR